MWFKVGTRDANIVTAIHHVHTDTYVFMCKVTISHDGKTKYK